MAIVRPNGTDFSLNIPEDIFKKIMFWVNRSSDEVGWFGDLIFEKESKRYTVVNVHLLKQEVHSSTTEIDEGHLAELMFEVHKKYNGQYPEGFHPLKWWGHSHASMPTFWSTQDEEQIRKLGYRGWILASVFNNKREIRTAFCTKMKDELGNEHHIFSDDLKTEILRPVNQDDITKWTEEFDGLVKKKVDPVGTTYNMGGSHYHWGGNHHHKASKMLNSKQQNLISFEKKTILSASQLSDNGYPIKGKGSPGWLKQGQSSLSPSGYFDSNGNVLYPDDRPANERQLNPQYVNGFIVHGYWVQGHYPGDAIIIIGAFSESPAKLSMPYENGTVLEIKDIVDKSLTVEDLEQSFCDPADPTQDTYEADFDIYDEEIQSLVDEGTLTIAEATEQVMGTNDYHYGMYC